MHQVFRVTGPGGRGGVFAPWCGWVEGRGPTGCLRPLVRDDCCRKPDRTGGGTPSVLHLPSTTMDEDHLVERGSAWRGCLHNWHSGDVLLNNKLSFWPLRAAPTVAASLNAPQAALIPQMCCCCLTIDGSSRGSAVEAAFAVFTDKCHLGGSM